MTEQTEDLVTGIHFGKSLLDPTKAVVTTTYQSGLTRRAVMIDLDDTMAPFFVSAIEKAIEWLSAVNGQTVEYTNPSKVN